MSNILKFPEHSRIQEEASRWLIRLDGDPLSEAEAETFSVWLSTSHQHRHTLVELCRLWDNMEILSELSELFPYDYKLSSISGRSHVGGNKTVLVCTLTAASLLLVLSLLLLQQQVVPGWWSNKVVKRQDVSYQTAVGEQKDILLEDGSVARLNTDSLITVYFSDRQRNIRLVKGEAYFEVAHAPARPFLVHAGGGIVKAVGTAFSVRLTGKNMEVTVTNGKVDVASAIVDKPNGSEALTDIIVDEYLTSLAMGQTAELNEKTIHTVKTIEPEAVSRKLSWQHGMLEFKGETLDEVVREISRYTNVKIIISDERIRDVRIGGYFKTGEVDALLAVLSEGFPITVNRVDDNLVYLNMRGSARTGAAH